MLVGYSATLRRAHQDGYNAEDSCLNARVAAQYEFAATQFTQNGEFIDHWSASKQYDIGSILHHTSENFADPLKFGNHRGDPGYYLLLKKDGDGKHIIVKPESFRQFDITDLDADAVRAMYPWNS
jgi:hypothetical protein